MKSNHYVSQTDTQFYAAEIKIFRTLLHTYYLLAHKMAYEDVENSEPTD